MANYPKWLSSFTPIDIDKKVDIYKYFQLAVLVDRPNFISEIIQLRKKWKLNKKLIPYNQNMIKKWQDNAFKMTTREGQKFQNGELNYQKKYPDWFLPQNEEQLEQQAKDMESYQRLNKRMNFSWDINNLRTKFKRPISFNSAIKTTLICGKITEKDYNPCYLKIIYPEVEFPQYDDVPEMAIIIDQFTTIKNLKETFKKEFKKIKSKFLSQINIYKKLYKPKHIQETKTQRKWYWENVKGLSYTKIAYNTGSLEEKKDYMKTKNKEELINLVTVTKAIGRYKRFLAVDI